MMSGVMAENDLVHSWVDTWGFMEAFIVWRGRISLLLHRFRVSFGWVGFGIMEMPGQDELSLHRLFTIKSQERRVQSSHDGEYVIVRVA